MGFQECTSQVAYGLLSWSIRSLCCSPAHGVMYLPRYQRLIGGGGGDHFFSSDAESCLITGHWQLYCVQEKYFDPSDIGFR